LKGTFTRIFAPFSFPFAPPSPTKSLDILAPFHPMNDLPLPHPPLLISSFHQHSTVGTHKHRHPFFH
jgi:hypothetical protein